MRLEERLELAAIAVCQPYLTDPDDTLVLRKQDEDEKINAAAPVKPSITFSARDQGRVVKRAGIHRLELEIRVRANAHLTAGKAGPFGDLCEAVEDFLDTSDLEGALTTAATDLAVMMVSRLQADSISREGQIRIRIYRAMVAAVKMEHTTALAALEDGALEGLESGGLVGLEG